MDEPIKVVQDGEDLYVIDHSEYQIELQVHDTAIYVDKDSIDDLIEVLRKINKR